MQTPLLVVVFARNHPTRVFSECFFQTLTRSPTLARLVPTQYAPSAHLQKSRNSEEEVMKVYRLFDPDPRGLIGIKQLQRVVADLGENISEEEMREMIDEADRDHDGECEVKR